MHEQQYDSFMDGWKVIKRNKQESITVYWHYIFPFMSYELFDNFHATQVTKVAGNEKIKLNHGAAAKHRPSCKTINL